MYRSRCRGRACRTTWRSRPAFRSSPTCRCSGTRTCCPTAITRRGGYHGARFSRALPPRFAIVPRFGQPEDIRWFEAKPCFVLHFMNAYEEGDEVVLDGYFQEDPQPPPLEGFTPKLGQIMAYLDEHSMKPRLYRWRFNLKTGAVKRGLLGDSTLA